MCVCVVERGTLCRDVLLRSTVLSLISLPPVGHSHDTSYHWPHCPSVTGVRGLSGRVVMSVNIIWGNTGRGKEGEVGGRVSMSE